VNRIQLYSTKEKIFFPYWSLSLTLLMNDFGFGHFGFTEWNLFLNEICFWMKFVSEWNLFLNEICFWMKFVTWTKLTFKNPHSSYLVIEDSVTVTGPFVFRKTFANIRLFFEIISLIFKNLQFHRQFIFSYQQAPDGSDAKRVILALLKLP